MKQLIIILGLLLLICAISQADDSAVRGLGGTVAPMKQHPVVRSINPKVVFSLKDPRIEAYLLSPDGKLLFVCMNRGSSLLIQAWEMSTRKRRNQFSVPLPQYVAALIESVSPHGDLLVLQVPDVTIYDSQSGKRIHNLSGHEGSISKAVFSTDGRFLATSCQDTKVRVWDVRTGRLVRVLNQPDRNPIIINGGFIVRMHYTNNRTPQRLMDIELLDVFSGKPVRRIKVDKPMADALLLPDGRLVVTYGAIKRVTDVTTGSRVAVMRATCPVQVLSPDSRWSVVSKGGRCTGACR